MMLVGYTTEESRKYREKHKGIWNVYMAVYRAIKTGKIKRSPCEICGSRKNIHAHHDNYNEIFNVRWLCPVHHKEIHCKKKN